MTSWHAESILAKTDIAAEESEDLARILGPLVSEGASAAHGGAGADASALAALILAASPHTRKLQARLSALVQAGFKATSRAPQSSAQTAGLPAVVCEAPGHVSPQQPGFRLSVASCALLAAVLHRNMQL